MLESVQLRAGRALAEDPCVHAEATVSERGDQLGIRRSLKDVAALEKFILPELVVAAVRVVVQDRRNAAAQGFRPDEPRRRRLDAVEVKFEFLEDVRRTLFGGEGPDSDLAVTVGKLTEQTVKFFPARGGIGRRGRVI